MEIAQGLVELLRQGRGTDVPIVGRFSSQGIPNTPPYGVGLIACVL
jgi:hypothetical protein